MFRLELEKHFMDNRKTESLETAPPRASTVPPLQDTTYSQPRLPACGDCWEGGGRLQKRMTAKEEVWEMDAAAEVGFRKSNLLFATLVFAIGVCLDRNS